MIEISPARRYSPVGECLRLVIMRRLMEGPAAVEELDELARKAVGRIGVRYDWRVWPELLRDEVVVENGVVKLTEYGRWLYGQIFGTVRELLLKYSIYCI